MRCHWFICESGDRWHRAVYRFGRQIQLGESFDFSTTQFKSPNECLAALPAESPTIVLWELSAADSSFVLKAIERVRSEKKHVLQFVGLPEQAVCNANTVTDVSLALTELGAVALLTQPVDLADQQRLIQRFWERHRSDDNLSVVHQIWDRLPWPGDQ